MSRPSLLRRILRSIYNAITWVRLALSNLLFLVVLALLFYLFVGGGPQPLPERAALLLNMSGTVVDQRSPIDPLQALLSEPSPLEHEVLLRDVLDALRFAAEDPAISALVMELDSLLYVGLSNTLEIADALEIFRASGKPIVAVGDYFTQDQYLLASHADEVIVHPLGGVALEGYSNYRNYFAEALDKLSVDVHVFRAGEHKSALEPLTRNDMSPAEKTVSARWLQDLWGRYTTIVETQRELAAGTVDDYVNRFPEHLKHSEGDIARTALQAGLVDKLMPRAAANDHLVEVVGAQDDEGLYEAVVFERYVARKRPLALTAPENDRVAVITAQGNILPGDQPPGAIGGESLARLIRSTAQSPGVRAIVLRINSGGGSLFASEVIRRQVMDARDTGLPVVVSMGPVAASGGYYIAADANEIWATPATLTGSIGVFAAFPTFDGLLERLGVHTDGVGTTELAGALRPDRPLTPELEEVINAGVDFAYREFLQVVATGRDMNLEQVRPLAEGRVWAATDALAAGLIDNLGGLEEAIASAAALADIADYDVEYVELPLSPRERLLKELANRSASWGLLHASSGAAAALESLLQPVRQAAAEWQFLRDPRHLYLRCLGCASVR